MNLVIMLKVFKDFDSLSKIIKVKYEGNGEFFTIFEASILVQLHFPRPFSLSMLLSLNDGCDPLI